MPAIVVRQAIEVYSLELCVMMKRSVHRKYASRTKFRPSLESLEFRALMAADLGFTPVPASVVIGSLPETEPFALTSEWSQEVLESQATLGPGESMPVGNDGSSWGDMLTLNETGPEAGRYLFRAHELFTSLGGNAGVSRTDLVTGETVTIAQRADFDSMDAMFWTPWGTALTGEESANLPAEFRDPAHPNAVNGLVYEILNPLADPADIQIVARPALGSMAHEGMAFDADGNVYVIDELNGGGIYKFVPNSYGDLSSGVLYVLKDADAADGADLGSATWIPLNNADGTLIPGVTDPQVNSRQSADDVGATNYLRPEDLQMSRLANGNEVLYVATTTDNRVLSIEFADAGPVVRNFVSRATPTVNPDGTLGAPVDTRLNSPDNLAIDAEGRIYIVEDSSPSDIWGTVDANNDGVAEAVGLFASLSTAGAEATGLYFNPFNPNEAFVNVQHSSSDNDATIVLRKVDAEAGAKLVNGVLAVYGTSGADEIEIEQHGKSLVVEINGEVVGRFRRSEVEQVRADAGAGDDVLSAEVAASIGTLLFGSAGNDLICAGPGHNVVSGGQGNDGLFGSNGNDQLFGNDGNDAIFGGNGSDFLFGGAGNDYLFGGNGADALFGEAGDDWLFGENGADLLDGGDDDDWLFGGNGADLLLNGEHNF
jgi:Ca2+-binding RTX toxin-like protein